jgi:hypothetical protein
VSTKCGGLCGGEWSAAAWSVFKDRLVSKRSFRVCGIDVSLDRVSLSRILNSEHVNHIK